MIHSKKIYPEYFELYIHKKKNFEIRHDKGDNYRCGDYIALNEYDPVEDCFTGRSILVYVVDVFTSSVYLNNNVVVMSVVPCMFYPWDDCVEFTVLNYFNER